MVARLLPAAYLAVNAAFYKQLCSTRVQQEMVDANTGVASKRAVVVIPERVDRVIGMQRPDGVRPPLRQELSIRGSRLRKEQCVAEPVPRFGRINLHRDDVVVAGKNDRLLACNKPLRIR